MKTLLRPSRSVIHISTVLLLSLLGGSPMQARGEDSSAELTQILEEKLEGSLRALSGVSPESSCPKPDDETLKAATCFDPLTDARASALIEAAIQSENRAAPLDLATEKRRIACSLKRAWERSGMDPRMILFRMAGESGANVNALNSSSKAWGLFQFLGTAPKLPKHRTRIEKCQKARREISQAAIQVAYYVDEYVRVFQDLARYGCKKGVPWSRYSALERIAYLGLGSCSKASLSHTRNHCQQSARYRDSGCPILATMQGLNFSDTSVKSLPLCQVFQELECPLELDDPKLRASPSHWCERL